MNTKVSENTKATPAKRKKRQRLPAEERKEQIIQAARKVFIERGLTGARTKDLAIEAGVNEATLFLYFKNKEEIFDAAITAPLKKLIDLQVKEGMDFRNASTPERKREVATLAHTEIFSSMDELAPLLVAGLFSNMEKGKEVYDKLIVPAMDELIKSAKIGFGFDDDNLARMVVITSLGAGFAFQMHNLYSKETIDPSVAAEFFARLIVNA